MSALASDLPAPRASAHRLLALDGLRGLAALMVVAAIVCFALLREPPERPVVMKPLPTTPPLRDALQWRLGAGSALLSLAQGSMLGFLVLYLVDVHDVGATSAAAALAASLLIGAVGRVWAGRVSDQQESRLVPLRRRGLMSAALLLILAVAATVWPAAPGWFAAPLGIAAAVATMTWNGLAFTAAGEIAGKARAGTAMSLQNTIVAVGSALGATVFGLAVDQLGWAAAYALLAAGPLLAWRILAPLEADETRRVRHRHQRIDDSLEAAAAATGEPAVA